MHYRRASTTTPGWLKRVACVAMILLAPGAVFAECSWVLWSEGASPYTAGGGDPRWHVDRATDTRAACEAALAASLTETKATAAKAGMRVVEHSNGITLLSSVGIFARYCWLCLPDTIGPRGPKSGR